ncbi:DNA helicase-2 / ATP-dependent DNA helicase PcrA [Butyrivibrio hungatei DSM 14810]|uniref:DNA helicase-2 / ATP-dependent DNA helicase PcrA n=1 Tax=Butyrivibrio hungatei DSM 14810 TaxID=1121132 RepID=A0A1M7S9Z1_9FIRM|nr:UvrD-helicase domain-containing protein [Butyrivibrio hungatei]SHN55291.1 DNA helicase-2 / ATP-dependent DNA helicase PcrA [Butyrivibrio hungatei DSM 14810]
MEQEIFDNEQKHLTKTYNKLLDMKKDLESQIMNLDAKATDEKNDIRDNIRFDYADAETTMETLGEIEVWNRYIDTYNIESSSLGKRLGIVKKLLESPYFAKIQVQFDPSEPVEDYYIGRAAISENGYDQMVIDWRSPIAEVYYNQESGHTSYKVEDREIPVDLKLRRQFSLNKDKLISFFDTQIAIEDPMLLKSLSQTHTDKMQAITATIQKEQNTVIRYPDVPVLLVNGIAGSGKTSVLLQRIAYLFFQKRNSLRPDQVCLMTLNPVFRDYIDNVLPDLGESNPLTITWQEFLEMVHVPFEAKEIDSTEAENLKKIHEVLPTLIPEAEDFHDIKQKETLVMTKKEVLSVIKMFKQFPMGMRLIQTASDELELRAKNSLRNMDRDTDDETTSVSKSDSAENNRIENDFGGALRDIKHCSFVNVTHIAQRILGTKRITPCEWLFTKMELTGMCDRNMRYVMIDEVQDYTKAQLLVFKKYFPNARFMLLGDEFQAIREGTISFDEIKEMAKEDNKSFVELPLMTSYRSSPEITDMFAALLPEDKKLMVSSVQRPGEAVTIKACKNDAEYYKELNDKIKEFEKNDGLTAIICKKQSTIENIIVNLGEKAPVIVSGHDSLPKEGAFIIELPLAKGLEFDHVILADADSEGYPDDELGKHCLYTAMSRATQNLAILSNGKLSPNIN